MDKTTPWDQQHGERRNGLVLYEGEASMNHQIAEQAVEGIMQHAMKHTGNLLNEFTVREIICAALAAEEKRKIDVSAENQKLRIQLSGEQEKVQSLWGVIDRAHEQLAAAERESGYKLDTEPRKNLSVTREGGTSEATRENAVNAACFPATTENKTTEVQALPRSQSRAAQSGEPQWKPKPATAGYVDMPRTDEAGYVHESKPAQEWTEKILALLNPWMSKQLSSGFREPINEILNSALAAEREQVKFFDHVISRKNEELAAQRERYDDLLEALKKILSDGQSREAQIARDALAMMSAE